MGVKIRYKQQIGYHYFQNFTASYTVIIVTILFAGQARKNWGVWIAYEYRIEAVNMLGNSEYYLLLQKL